jgi:deazaflavin-dependent oxidoreductase (nitroreductase family)
MSERPAVTPEFIAARRAWGIEHKRMYLESGGAQGHIMDVTDIGGHAFTTMVLLRTVGRKTGQVRINPLIYGDIGGEVVVAGSKGGAPEHPAWYLNIKDSETVDIQIATEAFRATWREPKGAEREAVWAFMEKVYPPYADYQARTERQIPLVMFTPKERIEVIRE